MWVGSERIPLCASASEESDPLVNNAPLTGYEPKLFDDFHYSETTEIFLQEQSSDTMPSYLHDAELGDETIGRALSSPLFTQEREEPAGRRQAYHSPGRKFVVKSVVVCRSCKNGPVNEFGSPISNVRENPCRDSIRILLDRQKEQILADCRAENFRMKLIVWMIREIFKMLNQYAVDNPTLPVNQRFSHLSEILAEC